MTDLIDKPKPLKILIVEDHSLTRLGLKIALKDSPLIEVAGEATNGQKALDYLDSEHNNTDVILMDISMPVMDGITATKKIKVEYPQCKVIMLTSHKTEAEIHAALTAGADGYCVKDVDLNALIHIIEIVSKGSMWLDPDIASYVVSAMINNENNDIETHQKTEQKPRNTTENSFASRINFTEREIDILRLLSQSKSCEEIATIFHLSQDKVNSITLSAMKKLSSDSPAQAAYRAYENGLIENELIEHV